MKVFEDGYDRRATDLNSVEYKPVRIIDIGESHDSGSRDNLRIDTVSCIKFDNTEQDKSNGTASTSSSNVPPSNTNETEQTTDKGYGYHTPVNNSLPITRVYDPKNQLSSLVRNARQNRDSLRQRNERISKTQQRSKRQYGW